MTIAENLDRIVGAKEAIKGAIIDKGVQVPADAKIDEYSAFVEQIQGGGGEDTLKQYLDGTLVDDDGVLDLRNYTELPSYFLDNKKYYGKVKQILWNDNTKIIPTQFMPMSGLEVFTLPKNVEHIGANAITGQTMNVDTFVFPNSLIDIGQSYYTINATTAPTNGISLYFHNLTFGENVKYIKMGLNNDISNPEITFLSTLAPQIDIDNLYVYDLLVNIHCWASGYTGGFWDKVIQNGGSFKYIEQLISQTYTGETSFDVSDVDIYLPLSYVFKYTIDGIDGSKDVVYDKKLSVYPVKEETTKVVPITTAQSTDEFTLNIKPFELKAPDMDLYYEFEVMEDCVIDNGWWRTMNDNRWQVWCDGELTTPETIYDFKKGERHNFGLVANNEHVFDNYAQNMFSPSSGLSDVLKPSYIEVNRVGFEGTFYTQSSSFTNEEKFCDLVVSFRTPNEFELRYCIKKAVYLEGIEEGRRFSYNTPSNVDVYIVADDLSNCGTDIRNYLSYAEKPNTYLKGELAQQLWDGNERYRTYINKFDIE